MVCSNSASRICTSLQKRSQSAQSRNHLTRSTLKKQIIQTVNTKVKNHILSKPHSFSFSCESPCSATTCQNQGSRLLLSPMLRTVLTFFPQSSSSCNSHQCKLVSDRPRDSKAFCACRYVSAMIFLSDVNTHRNDSACKVAVIPWMLFFLSRRL